MATNAAIGFHDIPVLDGRLVQARDDLGTPQSHGCIRQWRPDAQALWDFAAGRHAGRRRRLTPARPRRPVGGCRFTR